MVLIILRRSLLFVETIEPAKPSFPVGDIYRERGYIKPLYNTYSVRIIF